MLIAPTIRSKELIKSGLTNIKIRISHKGDTRYLSTKYYILPEHWINGQVSEKNINSTFINIELKKILVEYESKLIKVNPNIMTIRRLVELLAVREDLRDFTSYFERYIDEKALINHRTSEIYQATLTKITKFDKRNPLMFEDINSGWLTRFNQSMVREGLKSNTKSMAFRNIKAVINHAINNDVISMTLYPFRRFNVNKETSDPNKGIIPEAKFLTVEQIRMIRDFKSDWPVITLAQRTFMLSFYLIGINNDDLYHLDAVTKNGRVKYTRAKTHRDYSIKLEPETRELMTILAGKKNLLCYPEIYPNVRSMTLSINKALKKILPGLTMYSGRRSWSTIGHNKCGASIELVAQALGHIKKNVTEGYVLREEDTVEGLNRKVLDAIK